MSAGVSSFVAGYLAGLHEDIDEWIFIDVADQHPDTYRFIGDCERFLGRPITRLKSLKFDCVADVARKTKFLNSPHGAACTKNLKIEVRKQWEKEHPGYKFSYIWGLDSGAHESQRAENMRLKHPEYNHEFPLLDYHLTKNDAHTILRYLGIKRPVQYDLGFANNNCVGCVKGGKYYWNLIRKYYPDVFKERAKLEREIGHSCINGTFLDELEPDSGRPNPTLDACSNSLFCFLAIEDIKKYRARNTSSEFSEDVLYGTGN